MNKVTTRELRNQGGQVLDRVDAGETLTVTREGRPIAEVRPLAREPFPALAAETILDRWRRLPRVELVQ